MKTQKKIEEKDEFFANDFYTPLSIAKKEISRRWNDKKLRKEVEDFIGKDILEVFKGEPRAMMLRYIATPNFEASHFFELAKEIGLKPLYGEFLEDKFYSTNHDKLHLAKMTFFHGIGKNGHINIRKKKLVDIEKNEGKMFCEIKTIQGGSLIEFHHDSFSMCYPDVEKFNAYCLRKNDSDVIDFYEKIFAVCLCHGVLFENFIAKENHYEKKFTNKIVMPAYKKVVEKFNLKPLISPISKIENEDKDDWMWYPGELEKVL